MAATRYTTPAGPLQRGRKSAVCLTCGKARLMHGHRGALQRTYACTQECYNTYRHFSATSTFARLGIAKATQVTPTVPGGVAR